MTTPGHTERRRDSQFPCRVCGQATTDVLHVEGVPSLCNYFWPSAEDARGAPRGTVHLTFCPGCDLISNAAFDERLVAYTASYQNSIHFSPAFAGYTAALAERLVDRYDLHGKELVEIGCGNGDFLALLCHLGGNDGVGFDPSHDPTRAPEIPAGARFEVRPSTFPEEGMAADFVAARHVLEHVPDPLGMLAAIRRSLGGRDDVVVYLEVPDATYMLEEPAIWDVIHEHCSYFTETCLRSLLARAGFAVLDSGRSLGGQYLWAEATPAAAPSEPPGSRTPTAALVRRFEGHFTGAIADWKARLEAFDPARTAIWGAGAKGVMFLNLVDPEGRLDGVVDINPHKQGRFVPCTGQQIIGPEALQTTRPDHIVVMNPLFRAEIAATLDRCGVAATLTTT